MAGLIIASPDDGKKPIYALASVNAALSETYFNWVAWPNFADRGKAPRLGKYTLEDLAPALATPLKDTGMSVTAFPLSHGGVEFDGLPHRKRRRLTICASATPVRMPSRNPPGCTTSGRRWPRRSNSTG